MNILYTLFYYSKALLTDKVTMVVKTLTPILMMLVLGAALKNTFTAAQLEVSNVIVVADDTAYNMLDKNIDDSFLAISRAADLDEAMKNYNDGQADAVIKIDSEGSDVHDIVAYVGTNNNIKKIVIGSSVNDLKNISNIMHALADKNVDTDKLFKEYCDQKSLLSESKITATGNIPRAIDYYGVTMLVLTTMTGALIACDHFGAIFSGSVGKRIKSSNMRVYENYIGMFGSMFLVNMIQGTITLMIMRYICRINLGDNMIWNVIIVVLASAMATAIGIFTCTAFNDAKQATKVLNMVLQAFAFVSGGYVKLDFGFLKYMTPNHYVQSAMFQNIYSGYGGSFAVSIAAICIITVLCLGGAIILGGREIRYGTNI